jgi:bifunctional DNA-binding transcriptional regulator/antitoxin component of YhaV-PrlF toxin-antitoxin module
MAKHIVKVSGGKSSFRIVIPREIIERMGWKDEEHVVIFTQHAREVVIRRLFDDETSKRSG